MYSKQTTIGILGSGAVGQRLANAFASEGNKVMLGTRNPEKSQLEDFKANNPAVQLGSFEETAAFGELLVLAVKGAVAMDVLKAATANNLSGKTILDATNPIDSSKPPINGVLHFFTDLNESLMEKLQAAYPDANFVKVFNSVGNAQMYKPSLSETPTMFIAGNSEEARADTKQVLEAFGWDIADMGKAEAARAIEPAVHALVYSRLFTEFLVACF